MNDNTITYLEFAAADREQLHAAQQFYGAVFGWQYQSWGDDYLDTGDSGIGSGLCVNETVTPPLAVIYCAQLEAAYNAVIAAGGDIVQEIFSFPRRPPCPFPRSGGQHPRGVVG